MYTTAESDSNRSWRRGASQPWTLYRTCVSTLGEEAPSEILARLFDTPLASQWHTFRAGVYKDSGERPKKQGAAQYGQK